MAIGKGRNRAKDFEDLAQTGAQDFDPEVEDVAADESDADSGAEDEDEFDGREHYVDVGKSRLRKPKAVALGPQYRGSKVDRDQLDNDDEDDPFSRDFDEDESEEEGGVEVDGEESDASNDLADDTEGTEPSEQDVATTQKSSRLRKELAAVKRQEHDDDEDTDGSDLSDEDAAPRLRQVDDSMRKELAAAKSASQQKSAAATISQATKVDVEKGRAVKKQRTGFDSLLNTRMKLQKSLIATNTLVGTSAEQIEAEKADGKQALEAAETAAYRLWSSINGLREDLLAERTNGKRKQKSFSIDTSVQDLWSHTSLLEEEAKSERDATIKKWHQKTQDPIVRSQTGGRLKESVQSSIIDVLEEQLSQMDRLIKRTQAPRSCAPLQSAQRVTEDEKIYDDADFYGLLLKELLEQKSADSVAVSNIDVGFQMRRENKTKRNVDTKASKGRKLRYTVHDKLQNFMAPEDRSTWGERQSDELFGSLFGQKLGLGEREDDNDKDEEDDVDMEEAGLMMFRS
ncbi:Protein BFR2 [Pseudocercospora fuligena]|uniref:Protein BFR2 n=1 Tax=Pseudocercospora fuligena TaxID=685502 RepID=A0A8H6R7W5_9PEZI|nr:Protein BFR2 [Pseudocercospora fuligena]